MGGFKELIDLITDGEPVRAATPNRAFRQLDGNIRYLRDLLEDALLSQANFIREATVAASVEEGQPVYFNSSSLQFELGIGSVDVDPTTGFLTTGAKANLAGVIFRKLNATKADILISGYAEVNLDSAIDGTITPGIYYLSNASPGKLTKILPPSGVPLLQVLQEGNEAGTWQVQLKQQFHDFLNDHRHYTYELVARPAGDHAPPTAGERHVVSGANNTQEGWLPATDPIFNGLAPATARFGYNLSVTSLNGIWPPVPLASANIMARKDNIYANDAEPVLQGSEIITSDHVIIDANGIWWMTDCYNEVPWPTNLNTGTEESVSVSVGANDCPVSNTDRLFLNWTQSQYYNDQTAVLSLRGREGSGLVFYCVNTTDEKESGHLEADFDISLLVDSDSDPGHIVFKTYEDGKFDRGPVVESIRSASPEIQLSSNVAVGENGEAYGNIVITSNLDITNSEFPVETVRLNGVEEEFYEETLALNLPPTRATDFRGRVIVPGQVALPSGTQMKLRFRILARAAGTIPAAVFTLAYRRIAQPSAVLTTLALPTSDTSVAINTSLTVAEDDYFYAESAAFDITAGDEVLFTLGRAAPDSYGGELHILNMRGIPVAGS